MSSININLLDDEKSSEEPIITGAIPLKDVLSSDNPTIMINNPYDNVKSTSEAANPINTAEPAKTPSPSVDSDSYMLNEKGTLNEPVVETLKRDLFRIGRKMHSVLNPFGDDQNRHKLILQWDLWGPLMFNILLASTLSINSKDKGDMFVLIFMIFWAGSFFIYLNGNLLGAKLGMFNIMCLIGYCMVPLNFCSIIFALGTFHEFLRIIIIVFCCSWSSYSSIGFVKSLVPEDKRTLLIYPIILEYLFLSGVILMTRDIKPKSIN